MLLLPLYSLAVPYLKVDEYSVVDALAVIVVSSQQATSCCPLCGQASARVHSFYQRTLTDLPAAGLTVRLLLEVRRFYCATPSCPRRLFCERLPRLTRSYGRRTDRAQTLLYALAQTLGGEAGSRLALQMGLFISPDSLLRRIRRHSTDLIETPRIIGIDDFAFRRGQRYGTLLVNLETHRPVDLLADRRSETLAQWLRDHPGVEIISRDRAGAYAEGARLGAPQALQVADRWHLLKNLNEAVQRFLDQHYSAIKSTFQDLQLPPPQENLSPPVPTDLDTPNCIDSDPPPCRSAARGRRLERYQEVKRLQAQGLKVLPISRQMRMTRKTVRRYFQSEQFPERAARGPGRRKVDPFLPYLRQRWQEGCHVASSLWQELRQQGFEGSHQIVRRAIQPWRQGLPEKALQPSSPPPPSARQVAWWLLDWTAPAQDQEVRQQRQRLIKTLCERTPVIQQVRDLGNRFIQIIRQRQVEQLDDWM